VGPWSSKEPFEVSVLLRRGSAVDGIASMVEIGTEPLGGRRYLSREDFAVRHGARLADVEKVRRFAEGSNLAVGEVSLVRRTMKLRGSPSDLAQAFGVELAEFEHPSGKYRGHEGPIQIPSQLSRVVVGVFGLDNRPLLRPHFRRNANRAAVGLSVPTVGAAYGFPRNQTGAGVTIALLEFGGGYSLADIQQFSASLGLPAPNVIPVGVDGASNAPTGDPNGPDGEVELDIEISSALAPKARIAVYFAPNSEQGFVDGLTTAIHDTTYRPSVVSISWGGPEEGWSAQGLDALEEAARDGALQGVTILAAAGDQGATDGEPAGVLTVDFPASSPYVVGCGGTRLQLSGSTIASEVVWNDLSQGEGATGGGVSEKFALPSYQSTANVPASPKGTPGRGVPDVAANADPETGYAVFVDGASAVIGGTSAVAPLWAALLALFAQALGKPLGYANPLLYSSNAEATFHQITSGNNGGYNARPGWNPCTGLGTPNGQSLLKGL
jgi:kumamolisin